ncbi:SUMF1/EgtB/PvdO family nonheme iron enzyme [Luteolibacter marinus]|uniref:SUMF1/EgtB/PvdO family nonheme iron enzyme n=1 Tax=Luteolibacter marinus TaxID=2776705 RepID=UPI001867EC30|nr:SUMF1/EgtB/PvdO family nonheme iron enzyme [Luteolibacter marinus]
MDEPCLRAGTLLGDYRLEEFIAESPTTLTWLATQASIGRPVYLVELKPGALVEREPFLADIRAQAAVDHPLVGSVYEAVSAEDHCFAAFERLPGASLEDRMNSHEALKPVQLAHVLRRVAEAALTLEAAGTATAALGPEQIFLDSHGVVRLGNLARAGGRDPGQSTADIRLLGKALPPLVADGRPGASRLNTVLAWMRGEGLERTLTWAEVRSYAEQIEQQLAETPSAAAPPTARAQSRKSPLPLVAGALAVLGAAAGLMFMSGGKVKDAAAPLPAAVAVPAGEYPVPDRGPASVAAFELSGHEVTIGQYDEFLKFLGGLPEESRNAYDDGSQPDNKTGHDPDGWSEMLAAAKSGGQWQGRAMSLDCPVVNVDWWDAAAYCEWKNVRLPSEEEWFAGLSLRLADPAALRASGWGRVQDAPPTDRTPAGLLGLAGSVAEWTSSRSINPANPLGTKKWVIAGASYLKPAGGALAREWTDDLGQRRADLGFRVAK